MAETLIQKQLYELFANSAKTLSRLAGKREDKTEEEWVLNGVKNLKRKTLGLIGIRKTFSLEDLAKILKNDLEIGEDIEEAREIIRGLYNKKLEYSKGYSLHFQPGFDEKNQQEECTIDKYVDREKAV